MELLGWGAPVFKLAELSRPWAQARELKAVWIHPCTCAARASRCLGQCKEPKNQRCSQDRLLHLWALNMSQHGGWTVQTAHVSVNSHNVQTAQLHAGCLVGTWDSPTLPGTCQAQQQLALAKSVPGNTVNSPCSRALEEDVWVINFLVKLLDREEWY